MLTSDNPIKDSDSDLLDRANTAEKFAKHIFSFDYKEGLVIGIYGEWGSGKTSYINLMRPELEKHSIVIDFNPWMFSDVHNLVALFFKEMGAQLKDNRDSELANLLEDFGNLLSTLKAIPFVGEYFSTLGGIFSFWSKKKKETNSLQNQRKNLIGLLRKEEKPITVILDDIDRLSADELLSILKLVRITGNFPNIIYILSFDKNRVINTLNSNNIEGDSYLEKIVQIPFNIPQISRNLLDGTLFSSLDRIIGSSYIDRTRWANTYWNIIKPTIKNIRDVRRYTSSLSSTFNELGGFIDTVDLLTIEVIRVFHPIKFKEIFEIKDYLFSSSDDKKRKEVLNNFIQDEDIYKEFLENIFNIQNTVSSTIYLNENGGLRKNKRLADRVFFDLYFEKTMSIEFKDIQLSENLWLTMESANDFRMALSNIPNNSLENVVDNLIEYEGEFTQNMALVVIPELYKNLYRVPKKEKGMFEFDSDIIWSRLSYRLLKSIPEENRMNILIELMASCELFGQLEIVGIVGHDYNRGHKLVSKPDVNNLENILLENIQSASMDTLIKTYNLSKVLYFYISKGKVISNEVLSSPHILLSLLKSSISEIKSQRGFDPTIYTKKILQWNLLIKIYGSEGNLIQLIEEVSKQDELNQHDYFQLALKYKNGYRHENTQDWDDID